MENKKEQDQELKNIKEEISSVKKEFRDEFTVMKDDLKEIKQLFAKML